MMIETANDPVVCHIPGFEGYLKIRYEVDTVAWKSPKVYFGNSKSIKGILIQEANTTVLDISKQGGKWESSTKKALNENKLQSYLDNFNKVYVGEWTKTRNMSLADSLGMQIPKLSLTLKDDTPRQDKTIKLFDSEILPYHWQVLVLPQGSVGIVSKDLFAPFLVKVEAIEKN
jgi:hypothetical protein